MVEIRVSGARGCPATPFVRGAGPPAALREENFWPIFGPFLKGKVARARKIRDGKITFKLSNFSRTPI